MNKRDRVYKRERHLTRYNQLHNIMTKHLSVAHNKYLNEVMGGLTPMSLETGPENAGSNGIKRAWLYLKLLWTESQGIPALVTNNRVCSSDSSKAKALHKPHDSVFMEEDLGNLPQMPPSPYECMPDITFSTEWIKQQLLKIKIDKASGPDLIPVWILCDTASELAIVLSSLFQQSYNSGTLPYAWKLANICAIFKKGFKADPKNYRPVSLTSLRSSDGRYRILPHITTLFYKSHYLSASAWFSAGSVMWDSTHHRHIRMGISPKHPWSSRCCISRLYKSFWFRSPWMAIV